MKHKGFFKIKGKKDSETEFEFELVEGYYSPNEIYEIAQQAVIDLLEIHYEDQSDKRINKNIELLKGYMSEGHTQGCALNQIISERKCNCNCKSLKK